MSKPPRTAAAVLELVMDLPPRERQLLVGMLATYPAHRARADRRNERLAALHAMILRRAMPTATRKHWQFISARFRELHLDLSLRRRWRGPVPIDQAPPSALRYINAAWLRRDYRRWLREQSEPARAAA